MSGPIKEGDLVIAVRGHECLLARFGGVPFVVGAIVPQSGGGWHCSACGESDIAPEELWAANVTGLHRSKSSGIPLGWLKRIPPLSELEGEKRDAEISA